MTESASGGTGRKEKPHRTGNGHGAVVAVPHGRVPPHNLDAERSLLGGLLLDRSPAVLKGVSLVCSAPDFYREQHRKIYEAMLSLFEDGIEVDRVSVKDRLVTRGDFDNAGGDEFLDLLDKFVPTSANLEYYAKIVHDKARLRRLIETAGTIAQLGHEQHGDVGEFILEAEQRLRIVVEEKPRSNLFLAAHSRFTVDELATAPDPLKFILWPYIQQQTTSVLSGGGGSGKTAFLMQLIAARALGLQMLPGLMPTEGSTVVISKEDRRPHYRHKIEAVHEAFGSEFDPKRISERFHLFDVAGLPVRLVAAERGEQFFPTPEVYQLGEAIKARAPDADLIIIETISRMTGGIESNPSLSALVEAGELLCMLTNASVLFVGHVGQNTARAGIADAYSARGGSALSDNARSSMNLMALNEKNKAVYAKDIELTPDDYERTLIFTHSKSNGAASARPRLLRKTATKYGLVLVDQDLSDAPRKASAGARKNGARMTYGELKAAVVDYVAVAGKPVSRNEVHHQLKGSKTSLLGAVKDLVKTGQIEVDSNDELTIRTTSEPPKEPPQESLRFSTPSLQRRERGGVAEPVSSALPGPTEPLEPPTNRTTEEPPPHSDQDAPV